ncbi:hypothetical protein [Aquipuribacter nitratireducens]|uniref:Uncharacterized protein n=1 Tax=Aquipuribacter nitratireducens TaxID=650104 RepID=A0ABW0GNS0_9MICO
MTPDGVEIAWIPLGAGARTPTVRLSGRLYERLAATREHRPVAALVHAALLLGAERGSWTVEVAPAWGPGSRGPGVCATGPVGSRLLGRARVFRYEVRRWRDGVVPDLPWALVRRRLAADDTAARDVLDRLDDVPVLTWGRDEHRHGDMWNSNSVVAWVLAASGVDLAAAAPPPGTRAPGWAAGLEEAGFRDSNDSLGAVLMRMGVFRDSNDSLAAVGDPDGRVPRQQRLPRSRG